MDVVRLQGLRSPLPRLSDAIADLHVARVYLVQPKGIASFEHSTVGDVDEGWLEGIDHVVDPEQLLWLPTTGQSLPSMITLNNQGGDGETAASLCSKSLLLSDFRMNDLTCSFACTAANHLA